MNYCDAELFLMKVSIKVKEISNKYEVGWWLYISQAVAIIYGWVGPGRPSEGRAKMSN